MSLRLRAAIAAAFIICAFHALPAAAAGEFTDSAGRIVVVPARVSRVLPADTTAEVLVYVLAPQKLAGWASRPRGAMPKARRLPVLGQRAGNPAAAAAVVSRAHPDLIIDCGAITPERAAFADQVSQATGVPYILIDNSLDRTPTMLRVIGRLLGVADRGDDLAGSAEHAINAIRGRLLIQSPTERPKVYYAGGPVGLETGEAGSGAAASIDAAGAINVTGAFGAGQRTSGMPQQLPASNPDVIIARDHRSFTAIQRNRAWRNLAAVRNNKVFLEPSEPFGWIDDPPGVNRLIGLYWLSQIFYPGEAQDDLRSLMADFYEKFYGIKLTDAQIEAIAKTAGIPPSDTPHLSSLPGLGTTPNGATPAAPDTGLPGTTSGVPGAVNEPGRRGAMPNAAPTPTPPYLLPK